MRDMKYETLEKLNTRLGIISHTLLGIGVVLVLVNLWANLNILYLLSALFLLPGGTIFCFWWGLDYADKAIYASQQKERDSVNKEK